MVVDCKERMGTHAMKLSSVIRLAALLGSFAVYLAQAQVPARSQVAGNVTAVDAGKQQFSLQTEKGETLTLAASDKTVIVHVPPGETDVKKGTRMAFADLSAGDRVVAFARRRRIPRFYR